MRKLECFLILSILLVLWIDYIPFKISTLVEKPEKIEAVITNLSLAYIASYIFYFINIFLPEKQNLKIIKKAINNNVVFIYQKSITLERIKNVPKNDETLVNFNDKQVSIEDFCKYNNKHLHDNLDSILSIKERLPTQLLYYTILLKKHPYFKLNTIKLDKVDEYIESYNFLSDKLNTEFKKL